MRFFAWWIPIAVVLAAGPAAAQSECAEGRVSTPETVGRCCWPGQSWSESLGRCSGAPACPSPFVAEGDACVPPLALGYGTLPYPVQLPEGGAEVDDEQDEDALDWPDEPPLLQRSMIAPVLDRAKDEGLIIAGLTTFFAGYAIALAVGIADEAAKNCLDFGFRGGSVGCGAWPYAFIPVIGGVLAGTVVDTDACCRNAVLGWAFGLPAALVQSLGLVLTGMGLFGYTETLVPATGGTALEVSVAPYVTEQEAGTWLRVVL